MADSGNKFPDTIPGQKPDNASGEGPRSATNPGGKTPSTDPQSSQKAPRHFQPTADAQGVDNSTRVPTDSNSPVSSGGQGPNYGGRADQGARGAGPGGSSIGKTSGGDGTNVAGNPFALKDEVKTVVAALDNFLEKLASEVSVGNSKDNQATDIHSEVKRVRDRIAKLMSGRAKL